MHRPRVARLGFTSRVVTLAMVAACLSLLPAAGSVAAPIASPPAPSTGHITEYPVTATNADPIAITTGPDGNLWFTDGFTSALDRIAPTGGAISSFPVTSSATPDGIASAGGGLWIADSASGGSANDVREYSVSGAIQQDAVLPTAPAVGIAAGPTGTVWATEGSGQKVAEVTYPGNVVTEFPTTTTVGSPIAITHANDGNLWFTEQSPTNASIGRLTPAGVLSEYSVTTSANSELGGITQGSDGNIWFALQSATTGAGSIGRISTSGTGLSLFPIGGNPMAITAGPDGNLWFTDQSNNAVGDMNVTGTVLNEFTVPSANAFSASSHANVGGITTGPDGNIWFTEQSTATGGGKVAQLLVQPSLALAPNPVAFGNQALGVTSTAVTITATASGGGSAMINAISITGTAATDFTVSNDHCTGTTLTVASPTCTLGVSFNPAATGAVTDTMTVTSTASTSPQSITLTGTGEILTTGVSPLITNYGNQQIGTTSTARVIAFGNAGPGSLKVNNVFVTGTESSDFAIASDGCTGKTLAPQGFCLVSAVFQPQTEGALIAAIQFNTNSGTGPVYAYLIGRGVHQAGYWLDASDGGIFTYGPGANFYGSAGAIKLNKPVVGMAASPDSGGYWLVATDGGIFSYGDATFHGSTGSMTLNKPIVGMAPTPDGGGYWLVASDGGIFAYGDAKFFGSTGGMHLNKPIVGMATTPDGGGYWLVASDGGIFAYGDAAFQGSTGSIKLNKPIVGMGSTPDGAGYWLVASDGGTFSYGDAAFQGSAGSIKLNKPIVGMASTPTGQGYWLVATDGGIFSYGDAKFFGSSGSIALNKPIVGMAPAL